MTHPHVHFDAPAPLFIFSIHLQLNGQERTIPIDWIITVRTAVLSMMRTKREKEQRYVSHNTPSACVNDLNCQMYRAASLIN